MADNLDGEGTEFMVFAVGECLRWSDDDALTRMDAEGVEILHVADGDAVVKAVAHHLVLNLFPTLQRFFDEHLGREREGFLCQLVQFLFIVAEAGAETTQCVGSTDDDGIAKVCSCLASLFDGFASVAFDGFHVNLVQFLHEEFTVFGVDDGLNRSAKHTHVVFLKDVLLIEFHAAVEGGLSTERQ